MFNWMKRKRIVAVLLIATMVGISTLFWLWFTPDAGSQQEVTETVIRGDIEKNVLATGILKPALQVNVGAQANGQLKKLYVKQGDLVKRGQLLAEIDPTIQENEVRKSQAELESSLAQKDATESLLKQYQLELKRQQMMNRDGAAVQSDVDKAASQYASQVAQLRVNEAQIIQSKMAMETAKANLGYTRILAPIDGEVLGIVTKEGQTIVSSQTVPTILVLANVDIMTVHTRISETDILKVHVGQPLWFYVVADPKHRYESVMDAIQEAPNEALQDDNPTASGGQQSSAVYYNGVFDINNSARQLRTSMTAQVFIVTAQVKNVLKVPVSALGQQQGKDKYQLLVKQGGKNQPRWVSIGMNDRRFAEVKEGLKEGDIVVLPQMEDSNGQ